MSHPDPSAAPDTRPLEPGEVLANPVTKEYARILELPWWNDDGRAVAELKALPGARVAGEHMHPAQTERFTIGSGELTVVRDGETSVLKPGESALIEPGVWHDWWNEGEVEAVVRVEITPGERFIHMIETIFGLGREGHLNSKGMPNPLQLAMIGAEFSDVIVFRKPPAALQKVVFGALVPIAKRRGYRGTYPSLSRTVNAPRVPRGAAGPASELAQRPIRQAADAQQRQQP
ncbi:MAG: cupin domain-containing protein [Solirubrobacterales bacterium]